MPAEEKMKKLMAAALAALSAPSNASDAKPGLYGYGSFDVSSAYVLYGARMNREPCYWTYGELNLDTGGWGSAGVSIWQNTDMTCRRKTSMRRMNEWDYSAYLRHGIDIADGWRLAGEAGHIWYKYHGLKDDAASIYKTMMEIYARLELQNPHLTPYLFAAYDWRVTEGAFATAGCKREFQLPFDLTFTPDFTAGGGDDRYLACLYPPWGEGKVKSSLSYLQLSGKIAYMFNRHFGVHAQIACVAIANRHIRSGIDGSGTDYRKQFAWGSIGMDIAF
jgi:hypothetical protein